MPGLAELQRFKDFSRRLESTYKELEVAGQEVKTTIEEFRSTRENPPEKAPFPVLLALLVSICEIIDLSEIVGGWTAVYSVIYGAIRLLVTVSLYIWAFRMLDGIKLIRLRRRLLQSAGRRILIAALSNAPIPYIGIILRLFPMDLFFVVMTYYDHSRAVQAIWTALGNPKTLEVATNIIRTKRGPQVTTRASAREGSERSTN